MNLSDLTDAPAPSSRGRVTECWPQIYDAVLAPAAALRPFGLRLGFAAPRGNPFTVIRRATVSEPPAPGRDGSGVPFPSRVFSFLTLWISFAT